MRYANSTIRHVLARSLVICLPLVGLAAMSGALASESGGGSVKSCRNTKLPPCEKKDECTGETTEVPRNSDGTCPEGSTSKGGSWVDNIGFEHHHEAYDYVLDPTKAEGCAPCGGNRPNTIGDLPSLVIKRVHRYRFSSFPSAFGPGVFTTFDDHLELNRTNTTNGSGDIKLFRVEGRGRLTLTETGSLSGNTVVDGIYHDNGSSLIKELRLLDANGALVIDQALAVTAVLTLHDGRKDTFEVIRTSTSTTQRWGRLIKSEDRNGNAITIARVFPRDATDAAMGNSRAKLWQIASVTDAYGNTATFTHRTTQAAGRWVVDRISTPTTAVVVYDYDTQGLNLVTFPDGAVSTISRSADTVMQQTVIHIDEAGAEGSHRRKQARVTNSTYTDGSGTVNQTTGMIRSIKNGAGEYTYFNQEEVGNAQVVYVYEGGTRLLRITTSGFDHHRKTEVATNYVFGQALTGLTFQTLASYETNGQAMVTKHTDNLARATVYTRDSKTRSITKIVLPDGSKRDVTYNGFGRITTELDRLNRLTENTYDAKGNLTKRTKAKGTSAEASWTWTYNARGQVLEARDALYDATKPDLHVTSYVYDTKGYLVSILESADVAGGARPTRTFTYDAAGRLSSTSDPDGRRVDYTYDSRNRVTKIAYGGNVGVTTDYEAFSYATSGNDVNLLTQYRDRNGNATTYAYDLAGRKTSTTWASGKPEAGTKTCTYLIGTELLAVCIELGEKTTYGYDYLKRRISISRQATTGKSLVSSIAFDGARRIASTQDEYGRKTYFGYDANDRVVRTVRELIPGGVPVGSPIDTLVRSTITNPPYIISEATYDPEGQRLTSTDGRGIRDDFTYDAQGRQVKEIKGAAAPAPLPALTLTTTFAYDTQGNRTQIVHPRTATEGSMFATAMTYSGRNQMLSLTEAVGRAEQAVRSVTYTKTGRKATEKDFRGNTTTFTYHPCCDRLKEVIDPTGAKTTYAYDFHGNVVSVIDANGFATTTTYDGRHRVTKSTNPEGEVTSYSYDDNGTDSSGLSGTHAAKFSGLGLGVGSDGSALLITNALGETVLQIRDGALRVIRTVDGNGNATTTSYDTVIGGLVETKITDAGMHVTRVRADGSGRVRERYDADSNKTTFGFDANGNRVSVRSPNNVGEDCVYDAADRDVQCTDTAGSITKRVYNAQGGLIKLTDPLLKDTLNVFDGRNRRLSTTDRLGGITSFTYDANNNLASVTDADGKQTTYSYDSRNLLISEVYPSGQATPGVNQDKRTFTYDSNQRLKTRIDQAGVTTSYTYDRVNRLIQRSYPDGLDDLFTYDDASRLKSAVSERFGTTVARNYDAAGRATNETQTVFGYASTVSYGFDVDNQVTSITYPNGKQVARSFNARHQLASVSYDGAPIASRTYDVGGRLSSTILGNGLVETRTYKADNAVASIVVPQVTNFIYTYDANKRLTFEDHQNAVDEQTFGYDHEDRVISWLRDGQETQTWTLSKAGDWQGTVRTGANAFSQTRSHSNVHEVVSIMQDGVTSPLTYDAKGNLVQDQQGQRYGWDAESRLVSSAVGASTSGYAYDALGRRLGKIANGLVTTFVHEGQRVIAEYEAPQLATQAIGSPALPGSFSNNAGTIILAGGGTDIWGTTDQFRYGYASLTGDGSVVVKVTGQTNTNAWAKSGLMIRETLNANSRYAGVFVTPGNGVTFQRRIATAGISTSTATGAGTAPLPHWLKLTRSGSVITAFRSTDGSSWTSIGSETVNFPGTVYTGVAVTSHNAAALCTTTFTNFAISTSGLATVASPAFARAYVFGTYIDEVLALITPSTRYYYHANGLYSVAALTDPNKVAVERYRYDAYGKQTVLAADGATTLPVSAVKNRIGFTGRYLDEETGLWYYRARYHHATLGRFITRDDFGYLGGSYVLYAYVGNKPSNFVDPSGYCSENCDTHSASLDLPEYLKPFFSKGKKSGPDKRKAEEKGEEKLKGGVDAGELDASSTFALDFEECEGCCNGDCVDKLERSISGSLSADFPTLDVKLRWPPAPWLAVKLSGSVSASGSASASYNYCDKEGTGSVSGSVDATIAVDIGVDVVVASVTGFGELTFSMSIDSEGLTCNASTCSAKLEPELKGAFGARGSVTILWWEYSFTKELYSVSTSTTDTITVW